MKRWCSFLVGCLLLTCSAHAADTVLPVMSSNAGPYQEAFEGFKEEMGSSMIPQLIDREITVSKDVKVIVAFGGKAALYPYPKNVPMVYAIAPGLILERPGVAVKIMVFPRPSIVMVRFKELQPALHSVAIFWNSDAGERYLKDLLPNAQAAHIQILSNRLTSTQRLPDQLRAMHGKADALWLWPDPAVVTPTNFATLREFARSNRIPFYAPTAALVSAGAPAAVSINYREQGRSAARAVKKILAGSIPEEIVFSDMEETVVSQVGMEQAGLQIPEPTSASRVKVVR